MLERDGVDWVALTRADYDLDDDTSAERLMERYRPDAVVHCAAWTDVDECAREPELAMRRNGAAAGELAAACAAAEARLVFISTNEVFDGERSDGVGYVESDAPKPINAYGRSKLAGERAVTQAYAAAGREEDLAIVRTAWLFGPPGNDFPSKVISAADRLPADEPLTVVADEVGSPTYALDLGAAVAQLALGEAAHGIYHLVNSGRASRHDVAICALEHCRPERRTVAISRAEFERASQPPAWAVLATERRPESAPPLRPWQEALAAYLPSICS